MRLTKAALILITAAVACTGEVDSTMPSSDSPTPKGAQRRSVQGLEEKRLIDEYFRRFPNNNEASWREAFATKNSRLTSDKPDEQKAIDAIYAAMARREKKSGPQMGHALPPGISFAWSPSQEDLDLVEQIVSRFPVDRQSVWRKALMSPNARVHLKDPEAQKLVAKLYRLRDKNELPGQEPPQRR
jgi:hypothetical protein